MHNIEAIVVPNIARSLRHYPLIICTDKLRKQQKKIESNRSDFISNYWFVNFRISFNQENGTEPIEEFNQLPPRFQSNRFLFWWLLRYCIGKREAIIALICRLMIIGYVYAAMFASIWRTRNATPLSVGDSEFALRFFLIVLTDAACWAPIITLKILAMTKYPVPRKQKCTIMRILLIRLVCDIARVNILTVLVTSNLILNSIFKHI